MQEPSNDSRRDALVGELFPLAAQAARIIAYLADFPEEIGRTDVDLASRIGGVSAEHVAVVRRSLLAAGIAVSANFETRWVSSTGVLKSLAENLFGRGIVSSRPPRSGFCAACSHGAGTKKCVETCNRRQPRVITGRLPDKRRVFQLGTLGERGAYRSVSLPRPAGGGFLGGAVRVCSEGVRRSLICRPLNEPECGDAFRRRAADFRRLGISIFEYALPSLLPSGRETFHAKIVLADASSFYVGSSNLMGSALDRSFECGVIVHGETARQLRYVLVALQSVARSIQSY